MRPPMSAIGSIAAYASSELGRNPISSTTTRNTDSPRPGSEADGSDSMPDSLLHVILDWVFSMRIGPRSFIQSGRNRYPYFDFWRSFADSRSVLEIITTTRSG